MKNMILKQQNLKEDEIKQFEACAELSKREKDEAAIKLLNDFNHKKKIASWMIVPIYNITKIKMASSSKPFKTRGKLGKLTRLWAS